MPPQTEIALENVIMDESIHDERARLDKHKANFRRRDQKERNRSSKVFSDPKNLLESELR